MKPNVWILKLIAVVIIALSGTTRAGTFTSDFTQGVDTNYWGIWTANAYPDGYTNIIDAQGVTFQRFADPAADSKPNYSANLSLGQAAMRKITTDGRLLSGDFVVTMTYTNLNNLVSSSGDFYGYAINRMKLYLQWGDGGAPERVHEVGAFSASINYYGWWQKTAYQGYYLDLPYPWQAGETLEYNPAAAATFKLARTNGVLTFYVNDQQLGFGEGSPTSAWTTNDIWSVTLMLGQGHATEHIGVTFQSCTISGPSVQDNAPVARPVLRHTPKGDGKLTFEWDTTIGQTCHVESATRLANPDWLPVGGSLTATNTVTSISYPIGGEVQRFYRVVAP